ncbi:fumarylacetoacetate hydrolase family protein [Agathobaculum sp.]|uniref:fumarylacetoacetate hydrolase family protein n=1 Tax=Agathobaculum sp. TaxID=2048138 RepID=UPI002A7F312B|nr:fumarylacetoacetate hydrolase family protein [Agathobaculum sp.]MDY3619012.1 fumarylacetoacetate hydrolase family protein [Agathobaculum sp.]
MKLYTYQAPGGVDRLGVGYLDAPGFLWPVEAFGLPFADMNDLICHADKAALDRLRDRGNASEGPLALDSVRLRAPIPRPLQDLMCLGINYADHAVESARFHQDAFLVDRKKATYFGKRVFEATGDGDAIPSYTGLVDGLDYEVELGVVLGKDAKNVPEDKVYEYIFGYTVINDVSARNLQTEHNQWYFGKSLDGFTPMGPCFLTADEVAFPPVLRVSSMVNGETRQDSRTDHLIHGVAEIIAELSRGMTLRAGTVIATGTPSGVGMGFTPPNFLKPGDVVTCAVEGIGEITNTVE